MTYESVQPGIVSKHTFSAGAHYDPDNVAFGPIVGLDEHTVDPGAGFDWHGHRGVHIVSWVLAGTLRHEDSNGVERFVRPGVLLVQSTGGGIRHRETNASDTEPLRFVQITLLGDGPTSVGTTTPPATVGGVRITVEAVPKRAAHELVHELGGGRYLVLTLLD
ncbi:pirin family protein [uncultured Jatrophihabitans sp.]|uniref:pirin family protein n=1 Tax=uncultured Jatrophihabitans sp. TaxID=1610747 RepID=UPI0035C9D553